MLEWVDREMLLNVSINAAPVTILLLLELQLLLVSPWGPSGLVETVAHGLLLFPLGLLIYATYHVARSIQLDKGVGPSREGPPSFYTTHGAFEYLLVGLGISLVAAVVYLALFTGAFASL